MPFHRPDVRIAHITDLHYDGSFAWKKRFQKLVECLCDEQPDALFVTGDLVNSPSDKHFKELLEVFENLYRSAGGIDPGWSSKLRSSTFVVCGNHDVAYSGLHFGFRTNTRPFRNFQDELLKNAKLPSTDVQAERFFVETGIAVFPYDSNTFEGRKRGWAANGHIADLDARTDKLRSLFKNVQREAGVSLSEATKIAILHHHPLPLPADSKDITAEPFMLLDNANHFLRRIAEEGVHLVLHGHRHVSGHCKFAAARYPDNTVVVSSCGSSCKPSESTRELGLFTARHCGSITRQSFRASQADLDFTADSPAVEAVSYAYRRKARTNSVKPASQPGIARVRSKSKVVRLIEDGSALVTVRLQGIDWTTSTRTMDYALKEYIHGGIGRVVGGWFSWLDESGGRLGADFRLPPIFQSPADKYEMVPLEIDQRRYPVAAKPDGCEISYVLFNGYCLTRRDFLEMFGDSDYVDEVSSVESLYPTEYLELILAFPDRDVMPKVDQVFLDCWHWPGEEPVDSPEITRKTYDVDHDETDYLRARDALRHRSELCQVAALIRHPQPNRSYTVRWLLPTESSPQEIAIADYERINSALLNRSDFSQKWSLLEIALRDALGSDGLALRLYAFDAATQRLRLLNPTSDYKEVELVVGRGIVGHAFRARSPIYYQHSTGRLSPLEMLGSTDDLEEILSIPILHPFRKWQSSDELGEEPTVVFPRVSGVFALVRRGDPDERDVLDPAKYADPERFLTLITRVLMDPLLETLK
jgi:3',5'-cyclic AMP phosphodiesterase CpdA